MRAVAVAAALLIAGIVALAPRGLAEIDFRRAERLFASREYEKGLAACDAALSRNPAHPGAQALRTRLKLALSSPSYRCGNSSGDGLVLGHIDGTIKSGLRCLEAFELEAAEGEFRLTLELIAVLPSIDGIQAREDAARAGLDRIAAMREDR